jgi:hypothetical protein
MNPARAIKVLVPVWGYTYVKQFLDFGLPSLLAPGNLPALVRSLPCDLVIMTREEDIDLLHNHPAWARLCNICSVEIRMIDELIVDGNHHVTITLAYTAAVRAAGEKICDTCFFFLVSDCLLADGSLAYAFSKIRAGANAVLAGHIEVTSDAASALAGYHNSSGRELALTSRELMRVGLPHLHPTTKASIVENDRLLNADANRLFWRVDPDTIIGRFYLMHMIALRPENDQFSISAPCDYSFVPEMCPSGKVTAITDSDDYLGVEMHALKASMPGHSSPRMEPKELGRVLSKWTTAQHRRNVQHTLVFHAQEIPTGLANTKAEADRFLALVNPHLSSKPLFHRHHPYWITALQKHEAMGGRASNAAAGPVADGKTRPRLTLLRALWRVRSLSFGHPPDVRPWHPRWPDFRLASKWLKSFATGSCQALIVSSAPATFSRWSKDLGTNAVNIESSRLRDYPELIGPHAIQAFRAALLVLGHEELPHAGILIKRIGRLLQRDGVMLVAFVNNMGDYVDKLPPAVFDGANELPQVELYPCTIWHVPYSRLRRAIQQAFLRLAAAIRRHPLVAIPFAPAIGFLAIASTICNFSAYYFREAVPRRRFYSSKFVIFRVQKAAMQSIPSNDILGRGTDLRSYEQNRRLSNC